MLFAPAAVVWWGHWGTREGSGHVEGSCIWELLLLHVSACIRELLLLLLHVSACIWELLLLLHVVRLLLQRCCLYGLLLHEALLLSRWWGLILLRCSLRSMHKVLIC